MTPEQLRAIRRSIVHCAAGGFLIAAGIAQAAPYELIYSGTFTTDEALNLATANNPSHFSKVTPFTFYALFDDSTPNLAPPSPPAPPPFAGFRAYAPSSLKVTIGGTNYSVDPSSAVTVAIFDKHSFDPDHYAVGLLVDPVHDGAGIVGDFLSASPDFTAGTLTPTVFGDFFGVGHASGLCVTGAPPACPHAVTPWLLHDANNVAWNLTLGSFELDYPVAHTPGAGVTTLNTAEILAVPEPATAGLMMAGLVALGIALRRRSA